MATETASETEAVASGPNWVGGGVAGFLAGLPFGLMIQYVVEAMPAVGALYGMPGVTTGWVAHLAHSVLFGLLFAAVVRTDALAEYTESYAASAGLGLAYGAALWLVFLVFVWPVWLSAVGFPPGPASLSAPYLEPKPLVGHLVYGLALGLLYPWTADW